MKVQTCLKCESEKPLEDFHFSNREKNIRKKVCKGCRSSRKLIWSDEGRECRRCHETKALDLFWKRKDGSPQGQCIDCVKEVRENRRNSLEPVDVSVERLCSSCSETKTLEDFPKNNNSPLGYLNVCKECHSARQRFALYKMSVDEMNQAIKAQNNRCAICPNEFSSTRDIHVDHDHNCCGTTPTCGKCTRGLLCSMCNPGIGFLRDSVEILQSAIDYLKRHGTEGM